MLMNARWDTSLYMQIISLIPGVSLGSMWLIYSSCLYPHIHIWFHPSHQAKHVSVHTSTHGHLYDCSGRVTVFGLIVYMTSTFSFHLTCEGKRVWITSSMKRSKVTDSSLQNICVYCLTFLSFPTLNRSVQQHVHKQWWTALHNSIKCYNVAVKYF